MDKNQNQIFRESRRRIGATQAFISKESGIDRSKLSLFENGYTALSLKEKESIAKALGLSISECFGKE